MAFYASKRKLRPKEHDETGGELNIIPYLDIMMNLIMFMLLSITGFAVLGILNVNAPSYSAGGPGDNSDPNDKKPLLLTVGISSKGFFVAATGAVLPGASTDPEAPTIPRRGNDLDFGALTEQMKKIKASFPDETKVIIAADPTTDYVDLVRTMDATRETAEKSPLFFDVTLAAL